MDCFLAGFRVFMGRVRVDLRDIVAFCVSISFHEAVCRWQCAVAENWGNRRYLIPFSFSAPAVTAEVDNRV